MTGKFNLYKDEGFFGIRPPVGMLKERFVMPPFSTWDARAGYWQNRKRMWLAKGIKSEAGRKEKLTYNIPYTLKDGSKGKRVDSDTSVFDPVVCELALGWWCKPGGVVLDPFAGGSVRGILASILGFKYLGIELRAEQVESNQNQITEATRGKYAPKWWCGDSHTLLHKAPMCDFLFSCPPYGNLEAYSDDPCDISNMEYDGFLTKYKAIINMAVGKLREDRFACFVVGNYRNRDKNGRQMIDFVGDTIRAFEDAGAMYYNDIVLLNAIGSGPMRLNGTFVRGARKVVKLHQNVLVFIKGDPRKAAKSIPVKAGVSTGEGEQEEKI